MFDLNNRQENPSEKRERLRQEELKKNPTGALRDGLDRAGNGNLVDVAGGMGWKDMVILIIVLLGGYILYKLFL